MSAPLPVFAPVNSAPELPPQSRAVGSTKASHQASKVAAANEAKRVAASELAAQRKALLQSNAPRLAVWGADRDRVALPASLANAASPFTPRFDHICLASSDVSHLSDFLSASGGRACEGFLTPVYLSSTFEFANCAELQVIAPVESFQRRKVKLNAQGQSTATTRAFWNGNLTPNPPQPAQPAQPAGNTAGPAAAAPGVNAPPPPQQLHQQPSAAPAMVASRRSTFLQRYLRRHGPSVHHVAFLVRDLKQAKERFQSFGYTIFGWSDRDPLWKEFFLTPKQALGVVIQIAESGSFSHAEGLSWTSSSALLSQTHLTPVVKKHIALISAQQEEWGPDNTLAVAAAGQKKRDSKDKKQALQTNRTAAVAATTSAPVASPAAPSSSSTAAASSSSFPPLPSSLGRLDLLGLRLRCGSEFKARRQWGDMLAASHCTATVDPRTHIKTLVFRWPQSAMYIAVDIEKDPSATEAGAWARKDRAAADKAARGAAAAARSESPTPLVPGGVVEGPRHFAGEPRARPSSPGSISAQWDGPKWIEMHAPGVAVGSSNAASAAVSSPPSSPSPAAAASPSSSTTPTASSSSSASSTSARGGPSSRSLGTGAPLAFAQRRTHLPLDPAIMRSAFVIVDQPMPLPTTTTMGLDGDTFSLTTSAAAIAQPLRAKM